MFYFVANLNMWHLIYNPTMKLLIISAVFFILLDLVTGQSAWGAWNGQGPVTSDSQCEWQKFNGKEGYPLKIWLVVSGWNLFWSTAYVFCVVFCRLCLSFCFWPLSCLFFFGFHILIMVSSTCNVGKKLIRAYVYCFICLTKN